MLESRPKPDVNSMLKAQVEELMKKKSRRIHCSSGEFIYLDFVAVYVLQEQEVMEDLGIIQQNVTTKHPSFRTKKPRRTVHHEPYRFSDSSPLATSGSVYALHGALHFHNQIFERNQAVHIETKGDRNKLEWYGTLTSITPTEVYCLSLLC